MARVAMVEPVVVVGNPVGARLALHTAERCLATVPQVVVADSDIARVSLDVDGSIALFLVGVAAGLSVEHVKVVHPDVLIVGIDADGIVHAEHVGEVAQLNAGGIADEEAEACGDSIVANALDGDIEGRVGTLAFHLNALGRAEELIAVGCCYSAYDADGQRTGLKTFLIAVDNVLQAGEGLCGALAVLDNVERDGLGIILGDVYDTCIALERAVVVVGTHTLGPALMGKARTVVGLDTDGCSLVGSGSHLCPIGIYGHYLECIVGGLDQSHHVGPPIGAVVAHQLGIDERIVGVVAALHIDMIGPGSIEGVELHIGGLHPAAGLGDTHLAIGIVERAVVALGGLTERDVADGALVGVGASSLTDSDRLVVDIDAGHLGRIVVFLLAAHGDDHLIAGCAGKGGMVGHRRCWRVVATTGVAVAIGLLHLDAIDIHATRHGERHVAVSSHRTHAGDTGCAHAGAVELARYGGNILDIDATGHVFARRHINDRNLMAGLQTGNGDGAATHPHAFVLDVGSEVAARAFGDGNEQALGILQFGAIGHDSLSMKRLHIAPAVVIVGVEQPVATLVGSQILLVDSIEREEIPRL